MNVYRITKTDREFARHPYAKRMTLLCYSLPALRFKMRDPAHGLDPWNPIRLKKALGVWSHGEQLAARFVLKFWNGNFPGQKFDLVEAMSVWDDANMRAFIDFLTEWNQNRWWP